MKRRLKAILFLALALAVVPSAHAAGTIWRRNIDGVIVQAQPDSASTPVAISGATSGEMDATSETNFQTTVSGPNAGVSTAATPDATGVFVGAVFTPIATPTVSPTTHTLTVGAGAGTGATVSFVTGAGSNLRRGAIQWTAGPSPSAGAQVVVTFALALPTVPYFNCFPRTGPTRNLGLFATAQSASGLTLSSANAPTNGTTYSCEYLIEP